MSGQRTLLSLRFAWLGTLAAVTLLNAAEPRPGLPPFMAEPQELWNRLFGPETAEDEKALADIRVSLKEEQRYGKMAVESFLAELKQRRIAVGAQGKEVDYLRALVATIRPRMKNADRYRTIALYLARAPECEARSFPGGTLVFFQGLLEQAPSEAAVVGIVGHELAHLDRGHHTLRLRRVKLAESRLADHSEPFSFERFLTAGTAMTRLWTRPFRPEDEATADHDGAAWAYAAGYDPREMARLFRQLHEQRPPPGPFVPFFLQTHPAFAQRAEAVNDLFRRLQTQEPQDRLYIGAENLRRRLPRSVREFAR